jgi:glycosyltransferase involved in cell wall biosynthesis
VRSAATVDILLSTYNGAAYLEQQLASLEAQTFRDWRLVVRDDGSSDGTVALLEATAATDARVEVVRDERARKGACGSFGVLLEGHASAERIMFCDQDDVWLPHKIERTLAAMRRAEARGGAVLVCSDLALAGRDLEPLAASYWRFVRSGRRSFGLRALLAVNVVVGCTVMINRRLAELALPLPPEAIMHDWWLALAAARVGRIVAIREPLVRYRQHGQNQYGAARRTLGGYLKRLAELSRVLAAHRQAVAQARAFSRRFGLRVGELEVFVSKTCATLERGFAAAREGELPFDG